ncbi:hypothetical protein KKG65_04265 [Patescibacteria group bacterium]|nr:hypothetical protein [Patescibacteria group bacterium]
MSQYEQDDLPPKLQAIADACEYELLHQNDRGRGGGPKKRGKSILTTIKQTERYQKEFRHYHAKLKLHRQLTHQKNLNPTTYAQWLQENIGKTNIDTDNVSVERFASTHGPGGQNINKLATAIRLTHLPTQITAKYKKERTQSQNLSGAKKVLQTKLQEHLNLWQVSKPPAEITTQFIKNLIQTKPPPPKTQ